MGRNSTRVFQRFLSKVKIESGSDGCWKWTGGLCQDGYGLIYVNGKNKRAHRFSYENFVGKITEGHCVNHRCGNPDCVNPEHLFTATVADSRADMVSSGRYKFTGSPRHGENNGNAKLSEDDVKYIKFGACDIPVTKLAKQFGVHSTTIYKIRNSDRWSCIR